MTEGGIKRRFRFPGFKKLDWYITRKFLGTYFFAIVLIIIIVIVFDLVEKIGDFMENHASWKAIAFDYYLNFIPYFINQFSGLFTFIAVIFFTSKLAVQTEIVAMLSSGISFKRLMYPYFLSATAIAFLSLALNLWVIPVANDHRIDFEIQYVNRSKFAKYEPNIYREVYPGTFAYIRNYDPENQTASYLAVEKYENSSIVSSLEASDARFDPETRHWTAKQYLTRSFDSLGIETFTKFDKLDTMINLNTAELGRLQELVKTMNFGHLNEFIAQQRAKGSDMMSIFEVERQTRFSYPFATFILTLIGVSLSSRKVRGGMGLHIGVGIALCFAYIMLGKFFEEMAMGGAYNPVLLVWMPNIIFTFIGIYLYSRAPK